MYIYIYPPVQKKERKIWKSLTVYEQRSAFITAAVIHVSRWCTDEERVTVKQDLISKIPVAMSDPVPEEWWGPATTSKEGSHCSSSWASMILHPQLAMSLNLMTILLNPVYHRQLTQWPTGRSTTQFSNLAKLVPSISVSLSPQHLLKDFSVLVERGSDQSAVCSETQGLNNWCSSGATNRKYSAP